ncbi:hypothetical protein V8F33_013034 [Rhypophila sp. PSN 637]
MAEIVSIPASVVGLIQGLELLRGSLSTIRSLKDAPAEAGRLAGYLENARAIVREVEKIVSQSSLHRRMDLSLHRVLHHQFQVLNTEIDLLYDLLSPLMCQGTGWDRMKIRLKWVAGIDKRLIQVSERLDYSLQLTLSLFTLYTSNEGRSSSLQIQQQLDTLTQHLAVRLGRPRNITSVSSSRPPTTIGTLTFVHGSATTCADLLEDACSTLRRLGGLSDGQSRAPGPYLEWTRSQVHGLLHDVYSGGLGEGSQHSHSSPSQHSGLQQTDRVDPSIISIRTYNTQKSPLSPLSRSTLYFFLNQISMVEAVSVELPGNKHGVAGSNHNISMALLNYQPFDPSSNSTDIESFTRCRLYVAPLLESTTGARLQGTVVQFFKVSGSKPQVWRSLATFGIHTSKSAVFEHIRSGNVVKVQRLFSLRALSPNDRDEEGNSLLWHCLENYDNYNMCALLLREGASPSDCNIRGDHALAIFVMHLSLRGEPLTESSLRTIDLLVQHSDKDPRRSTDTTVEPTATLPYKSRDGVHFSPAGVVQCATPRRSGSGNWVSQLPSLLQRFGSHFGSTANTREGPYLPGHNTQNMDTSGTYTIDLEFVERNGNTALLYTLFYHPVLIVSHTAGYLIDVGANIAARNKFGEGGLHLLCRRLSACNIPNLSDVVKSAVVKLMCRLIQGGCDPLEGSQFGFTPVDAAMTPAAWPLFCQALNKAGRDVKSELKLLDLMVGIDWAQGELEELRERKVEELVSSKQGCDAQILKRYLAEEQGSGGAVKSCYLCGGGPDEFKRQRPFDEFYSDVVTELGHGVHMVKYYHYDDLEECLHVHEEDSCFPLDYHPVLVPQSRPVGSKVIGMSKDKLRERSWRRHVAAYLWERGLTD